MRPSGRSACLLGTNAKNVHWRTHLDAASCPIPVEVPIVPRTRRQSHRHQENADNADHGEKHNAGLVEPDLLQILGQTEKESQDGTLGHVQ